MIPPILDIAPETRILRTFSGTCTCASTSPFAFTTPDESEDFLEEMKRSKKDVKPAGSKSSQRSGNSGVEKPGCAHKITSAR